MSNSYYINIQQFISRINFNFFSFFRFINSLHFIPSNYSGNTHPSPIELDENLILIFIEFIYAKGREKLKMKCNVVYLYIFERTRQQQNVCALFFQRISLLTFHFSIEIFFHHSLLMRCAHTSAFDLHDGSFD